MKSCSKKFNFWTINTETLLVIAVFSILLSFISIWIISSHSTTPRRSIAFCVPPASPKNGQVSIGSVVTRFTCSPGHKLDGSPVAVCVGGRWSTPVPRCVVAGGKSKSNGIKGEMDVQQKDQQIVTAYTHFPHPSKGDRSKSGKRKSRWKKRRRKGRRKKSKANNNQLSETEKDSSSSQNISTSRTKSHIRKGVEKRKNKLTKKERRQRRRQERRRNKGKRKDKNRKKGKRKHRKRRKKIKDRRKGELNTSKVKKKGDKQPNNEKPETNSIHYDGFTKPKQIEKNSGIANKVPDMPAVSTHSPKTTEAQKEIPTSSVAAGITEDAKSNKSKTLDHMDGIDDVGRSNQPQTKKTNVVPTNDQNTDPLQKLIDRMMNRNGNRDSNLLDDFLLLKVETDRKNIRHKQKSKNEVRSNIPETTKIKTLKQNPGKYTDYEDEYDPVDYLEYPDGDSSRKNSSNIESSPEQELPAGYPSLEDRVYGNNDINTPQQRFIEEENILFSELDTTCTISDADSIYLPPPRVKNGHVTTFITVTNPAPPNNVYVEANYDCNFGYQLSEPTNSRLFCKKNSWIGMFPKCTPYTTGGGICDGQNGGCQHICNPTQNDTFICSCYRGFTLDDDKVSCRDVDECALDNGDCEGACFNKLGSYQCYCPQGYRVATNGKTCVDKNECILRNGHGPCQDTCFNTEGSYYCTCDKRPGTTLSADNHTCEDLNECAVNNGGCSHICLNTFGQTFCGCPDGYSLTMDWKTCTDINECDYPAVAKECDLGCINTIGSYRCAVPQDSLLEIDCPAGERLNLEGTQCEDIDECATDNFGCSHACVNTEGSAHCECPPDYELQNGKQCVDIDECKDSHKCSHGCVNTDGSYKCSCPVGRILSPDQETCIDANECADANGGCEQICVNLDGSHECSCHPGFILIQDHACRDVDECQQKNGGCQQVCHNNPGSFYCSCYDGYDLQGSNCVDIDECDLILHKCEQSCSNSNGSYECSCYDGYDLNKDGVSCRDVDECTDSNPCSHFCSNKDGSFVCSCPAGWILADDERTCVDIDECQHSACSHGCENIEGGYKCTCPSGLRLIDEGTSKENTHFCVDIDECLINNGNCTHLCNNLEGSFECFCPTGFQKAILHNDSLCKDVNECIDRNGGCSHQCINEDGSFKCECPNGLRLTEGGLSCEDVDECSNNNGDCSHTCVNLPGTYECTCPAGWEMNIEYYDYDSNEEYFEALEPTWKTCTDVDECQINNGGCSHDCINGNGSFHCSCPIGYDLINDYSCQDINECMVGTGPCSHMCINVAGTFKCECPAGFELIDVTKCQDVNECLNKDACSHECLNEVGTYRCLCPGGFVMEKDNITCTDFNECGGSNGGCSHSCENTDGKYVCSCPKGLALGNDLHSCEDVDECVEENGGCSHKCLNQFGSYACSCSAGLMLAVDRRTCLDIDECGTENGGCSHQCFNHEGHYKCLCPAGTKLQADNHTCEDIDECLIANAGCSHKCYNIYGTYECICSEGYSLQLDNHTCHDVDECEDHNGRCQEICYNTRGSYRCDCGRGYQLASDLQSCKDIDECKSANGGCSHFCENMPGSFFCSCPTGYNLDADGFQCADIDECTLGPCEHSCVNTGGSFYCACDKGYYSRPDSENLCHDTNECEVENGGCSHDCFNTIGSHYCGCPPGYHLADNNHSCEKKSVYCPLIVAPLGSYMNCSLDPISASYKTGTSCNFSCQKGFTLRGRRTSYCGSNGAWSNALPTCNEMYCPGMPNIEFGVITPYRCIQGTSKIDQHCYLACSHGYKLVGNPVRTCKEPGTWVPTISPHCVKADTLKPFIQCPKDMIVDLSPHQSFAYVRLPRPKSNVDWYRYIDSSHDWAKELEADIPAGATVVTFTAHSPLSEEKASCTFEVFVKDTEVPQVFGCPKSFKLYLTKDEDATEVTWKEPVFKDNVEIVHIYKSMDPGALLGKGTHPVHYIAVDPQGNRAKCSFVITVEEDLPPDEPTHRDIRNGSCGLQPGPIPGGMWVCNDWEWGRICKPNCPPSKVLINPSSNLLFMCVFSSGTWNPDANDIYSRPACSKSVSVKRGMDCMLGYEREKTNSGACMACTPGMYRSKSIDRCIPCQVGYYSHTFGSSECKQCAGRRTTTSIGTHSRSLCHRRDRHSKRARIPQPHFTRDPWSIYDQRNGFGSQW